MKKTFSLILSVMAIFALSVSLPACASSAPSVPAEEKVTPPAEWTTFIKNLQREMLAKGISQKTIDKAYKGKNYYHKAPDVVKLDKKQAEFVMTTCNYVNRLVSKQRVEDARKHYRDIKKKYAKIEQEYNVPLNYIVSFWGVETNFGQNKGQHHLIDSLTNLSYRNRRSEFFKNELYNVLKIMDKTNLSEDKMRGSWAGAMGHFQFMPSTYNSYAVDYDGDKVPDIWNSFPDALASAENYLTKLGWKTNEPWGTRVQLPWDFDFKNVGRKITKKVSEWKELGVLTYAGNKLPFDDDLKGSIMVPDGRKGPAYLVFGNFKRVMIWNRSDNYAIAVVTLADYIVNDKKWTPLEANEQYALNSDDIRAVQKFYNRLSSKKIKEDGKLGPITRESVKFLQHKAHLPEDGYPDYALLQKIATYDAKKGFKMPVPSKKPKK
ncbi:MAG: lytic murein transglycosylase [Alphaproteobacteria bacterium]|nr:lytic murein transglycosylase [Alphaproteobacteria bacterium]